MLRLEIWGDKTETIRRSRLEYLEIWRDKTEAIQRSRLEYLECVSAAGILGVPVPSHLRLTLDRALALFGPSPEALERMGTD